ncbi:MAG: very short patch repair endonuclease [Bacteroidales bacterium]|nr:very short patch repair endonuclease [Bacteroidales bacterium]
MDKLTPEQRHKNMVAVKGKGTKIEILLGKSLWNAGLHFRKNNKTIFGHPDFSHKGKKIAIFCDGEMWHGKDWEKQQADFKSNREFWIPKIERNIARDKEVNARLQAEGWAVIRFWETDIKKNITACVEEVRKVYEAI